MTKDVTEADSDKLRAISLKPYLLSVPRSTVTAATAPFRFMHGHDPKAPVKGDIDEYPRLDDLAREVTDKREKLQQNQRESVARYDEKRRTPPFQKGEVGLLESGVHGALGARYEGPFSITTITEENTAGISRVPLVPGKVSANVVNRRCPKNVFWTPASCRHRTTHAPEDRRNFREGRVSSARAASPD
ncbi:hypothetical protein MTO96_033010 [Rhipicephalus appendiculatus]